ncbi:hypothetical protein KOW79_020666 [Hemibagrus wyckioides]|uniref:Nicotinamide N-methyltransferase n=1 Tax=Hemibagrus wyckioides TaxID=337641 RepID=A0A9D3S9W7_9TELE|nr:nicotinamide N-methyltransferase-like [Hemibagrus wyckioides]KAG7315800.1 hypothetical protein KOW79_020666 [Hemibagrus wyckioides]
MAESSHFTEAEYYQKCFDSRAYMNNFYSRPEGHSDENNYLSFVLGCLSRIFSTGEYKGRKLIEVGSGPTIHTVISACQHYHELVLSDFVDGNREEIKKWINNEEGCFDWKPIIEYVCELDGKSSSDVEVKLRQKIKQVLKCNVLLENPFHPESIEPADCVITSLCLEAACKDMQLYTDALCGVTKLLRPGGVLVMVGVLGETFYRVDEIHFSCLRLSKENIEDVVSKLGFTVQEFNIFSAQDQETNKVSDFEAFFVLVALKTKG